MVNGVGCRKIPLAYGKGVQVVMHRTTQHRGHFREQIQPTLHESHQYEWTISIYSGIRLIIVSTVVTLGA